MESGTKTRGNHRSKETEEALGGFFDKYNEKRKYITFGKLLEVFEEIGLLPLEDLRMKNFMDFIRDKGGKLTREEFIKAANMSDLLKQAICGALPIKNFPELKSVLQNIYDICKTDGRGSFFFLNMRFAIRNPDAWEAYLVTACGRGANFGDTCEKFTVQSAIKPFMYALAVELLGVEEVMKIVGMTFHFGLSNSLDSLNEKGIPKNANINSGGIALCSYIKHVGLKNMTKAEVFDYVMEFLKDLAGNKYVNFSDLAYMAEKEALTKNQALIYHLRKNKCLPEKADIEDLYFYFATCSFEVTSESLSIMGATIANYGINPITGKEVLKPETCKYTMAMMQYCTPTPSWIKDVGVPAACGASGSFLIILPRLFAISMFSPKIDNYLVNYRARSFCKALVFHYNLNMFHVNYRLEKQAEDKTVKVHKPCLWHCSLFTTAAVGTAVDLASTMYEDIKPCFTNFLGRNLLHDAAAAGNMPCVSYFMQKCPHMLERKDCKGFTPYDDAKFFKNKEVIEFLEKWISLKTGNPVPKKEGGSKCDVKKK